MKNVLCVCMLSIFSLQTQAERTSAELFNIINQRLSYMEDVALFKAENHLPVEDISREKRVIDKAKRSAAELGLDPERVEDFFKAQISVAKAIQYRYRADLLSRPPVHPPRDLQKVVRPALIRLGNRIVQKIADYIKSHGEFQQSQLAEFDGAISVKYVTKKDKQLLFNALLKIK